MLYNSMFNFSNIGGNILFFLQEKLEIRCLDFSENILIYLY